jgi:TonB family protein
MDHATRPPMLAAAALSAALHAAALALVLALPEQLMDEPRQVAVEIAWVQGKGAGEDSARLTTHASPAGLTRGSIARTEPWIAGSSSGEDAEKNQADEDSRPKSAAASQSAESPPTMSPSGLTRGSSQAAEPGTASAMDTGPSDQVRGRQSEVVDVDPAAAGIEPARIVEPASVLAIQAESNKRADLGSTLARSRNGEQQLAAARPSSPAFLTLSTDLTLRQAQEEVGSRRARKREKEPEPPRSEPSPACGRGQGEGGAICATASKSREMPASEVVHRQHDGAESGAPESSAADQSDATTTVASAAGAVAPGASPGGAAVAADGDIVSRVPPAYPLTARRQGLQGTTMVRAHFDASGLPDEVAVVASSGSTSLDDAAREAVRRWRFRAGAAGVLDMPITFRLDGFRHD